MKRFIMMRRYKYEEGKKKELVMGEDDLKKQKKEHKIN